MKKLYLILLMGLLCAFSNSPCQAGTDLGKDQFNAFGETLIKDILGKIKSSDSGRGYLTDVDPSKISLNHDLTFSQAKGWIVRWRVEKGAEIKPNPNPNAPNAAIQVVTEPKGIVLELFVSYQQGDMLVDRTEALDISKTPRITVGYLLKTKEENKELKSAIHDIIWSEAPVVFKSL